MSQNLDNLTIEELKEIYYKNEEILKPMKEKLKTLVNRIIEKGCVND